MPDSLDIERELRAYQFEPAGEETESTVIWKDKGGNEISVAKEYERCPDQIKLLHIQKIRSLHSPHPIMFRQAYCVEEENN